MNIDAFLTCLGYFGISTGASDALEGLYALNSGTTGLVYNQLYPTGSHFSGGQIAATPTPLINITNNVLAGNVFSGVNTFRFGYQHTGNFSLLIDIESSGCLKRLNSLGKDEVVLSTASSPSYASGFAITINDANRLVFKTLNKAYTLEKELTLHDLIYIGLAENQYVNFGVFNVSENLFYNKSVSTDNAVLNSNDLYLGGFLNNTDSANYTGFYGKINQIVLFDDTVKTDDVSICSNCIFASGYTKGTGTYVTSGIMITGVSYSGTFQNVVTGIASVSGQVGKTDGSILTVILASGITGFIQTGEIALPLLQRVPITGTRDVYTFYYDNAYLSTFANYQVQFDLSLTSGDVIEVYTYPKPNLNLGKRLNGFNFPTDTGFIQLIGNGLAETSGLDYFVSRNQVSGFDAEDVLSYDVLNSGSLIFDYSGYWQTSRVALSGGAFFPPAPQFYENTGVPYLSGKVIVTGLSGICSGNPYYPSFGYDVYLNGQKLVSGLQYDVSGSGVSGFVVLLSGLNLPSFIVDNLYAPTGGLPTGVDLTTVDDSELMFLPQYSGFNRSIFFATGTSGIINNFSGFSEQIWINGIRQVNGQDYTKFMPCVFCTGITQLPEFANTIYDSDADIVGLWNFEYPPRPDSPACDAVGSSPATWAIGFDGASAGSYPDGNFVELWSQIDGRPWQFISGNLPLAGALFNYSIPQAHATGTFRFRYRNGNIIGQFNQSDTTVV